MTDELAPGHRYHLEFRYTRLVHVRWVLSGPHLLGLLALASGFLFRGPAPSSNGPSVVTALSDEVPVWDGVFLGAATVMLLCLATRRFLEVGHVVAAAALTFYGFSLLYTEVFLQHISWGTGSFLLCAAAGELVMAGIYAKGR